MLRIALLTITLISSPFTYAYDRCASEMGGYASLLGIHWLNAPPKNLRQVQIFEATVDALPRGQGLNTSTAPVIHQGIGQAIMGAYIGVFMNGLEDLVKAFQSKVSARSGGKVTIAELTAEDESRIQLGIMGATRRLKLIRNTNGKNEEFTLIITQSGVYVAAFKDGPATNDNPIDYLSSFDDTSWLGEAPRNIGNIMHYRNAATALANGKPYSSATLDDLADLGRSGEKIVQEARFAFIDASAHWDVFVPMMIQQVHARSMGTAILEEVTPGQWDALGRPRIMGIGRYFKLKYLEDGEERLAYVILHQMGFEVTPSEKK